MPILVYFWEFLGFKNIQSSESITIERAIRFYLDVHRFTAIPHLGVRLGGVKHEVIDGSVWYVIGTDWLIYVPLD